MKRRIANWAMCLALLAATFAMAPASDARAQEAWPQKPIRVVVAFPPGAVTDNTARRMAQILTARLNQTMFVENKPGASGAIGVGYVMRERPDGHTLLIGDTSIVILPHTLQHPPFDLERDFVPIGAVMFNGLGIVVNSASPYRTLQDLIAAAKARPGAITYGGPDGSNVHLASEDFAQKAGIKLLQVPYKGTSEAVLALLAGQIDMQFASASSVGGNLKAGKLRMLAISGNARTDAVPDVPTFAEAGLKEFAFRNWIGYWAPKGTPKSVIDRLKSELSVAINAPEMKSYAADVGGSLRAVLGDDFAKLVSDDSARFKDLVERVKLQKN